MNAIKSIVNSIFNHKISDDDRFIKTIKNLGFSTTPCNVHNYYHHKKKPIVIYPHYNPNHWSIHYLTKNNNTDLTYCYSLDDLEKELTTIIKTN